ncbi:MAG TPA: acetate--CoA ligase family protein [Euzebyales bacterium]|nr:acetate--CoA ligase family protein [Euzebyales bacterium]
MAPAVRTERALTARGRPGGLVARSAIGENPSVEPAGTSDLRPLLEARSVAVVGASSRSDSVGQVAMAQLLGGGFDGAVHPVNPRYAELCGLPCVPRLADVVDVVDLAVLAVGNERLEAQLEAAAAIGARAAVIFASAFEHDPGPTPLTARLAAIARSAGMVLCGANSMGFVHLDVGLRATAYAQPLELQPGPVTLLTHSGSVLTAMLHNRKRVRFNLAVSTGQELVTTMAEYLRYAVERPTTRVVALFCETVRDPEGFVAALDLSRRGDVAVVALTVGRHAASRDLVTAHSGALAGADGAYEAVFDAYDVHRVRTIDELLDATAVLSMDRGAAPGGLAVMHDSGGERAHLLDLALDTGVALAAPNATTRAAMAEVLDAGLPATNPLDAWGSSVGYHDVFMTCGRALLDDSDTAALAFCVDLPDAEGDDTYPLIARELHAATDKPVVVLANVSGAVNPVVADRLRAAGIVVLEGTTTGLAALSHLLDRRDRRARVPAAPASPGDPLVRQRWRKRLRDPAPWTEVEALALLADHGMPVVAHAQVEYGADAVRAADRLGYPVVLKTAADVAHKSDVAGVHLDLRDAAEVRAAYDRLAAELGPRVTVAAMARAGVELALGVTVDPTFGPLVVVGAGGVLVEVLADRRVTLPPVDAAHATDLLGDLSLASLLRGVRDRPAVDLPAVAAAVVALSTVAVELGDLLAAVDVNPLICSPDGCVAVDALVVPARGEA